MQASPAIALPTGGGAIRGIDEKFAVQAATGSGAMTVPIATSPARQGFGPELALSYASGSGAGPFGLGWSLSVPRITRKTDKGLPIYHDGEESDVFVLSGAEDLVPVLVEDGGEWTRHSELRTLGETPYRVERYRPRIEGLFSRVERWTDQQTGDVHWRSLRRDNVTIVYGRSAESRIVDPADPARIFSWLACESYDGKGNALVYRYQSEDSSDVDRSSAHERHRGDSSRSANRYLKRIRYGNRSPRQAGEDLRERSDWMFEVVFDYGEDHLQPLEEDIEGRRFVQASVEGSRPWTVRSDPLSSYRAGFEVRTYRLCRRILMFHHFHEELGVADYLVRATHFDFAESSVHTVMTGVTQSGYQRQDDGTYEERSLPPVELEYSRAELRSEVHEIDLESLENLPTGLSGSRTRWVDLDGEGVSGILTEHGDGWFYKPNLGEGRFGPQEQVAVKPSAAELDRGGQLLDLAGDGQLDLVTFAGPAVGFHERTPDHSWSEHKAFASVPAVDWGDANLRFVDLTGDGHADVLITEDQVFTWYPSLAESGFDRGRRTPQPADEEAGPRLVFADAKQSIYLADMSGDGLVDLARIRNGSVCYWPNLGYGRFGAKVSMDDAPRFEEPGLFDQSRILLGDVDGSGITDILYLRHDRVDVYFNRSGNGWTAAQAVPCPSFDALSEVTVTDLLGNGTACLVWSSSLPGDVQRRMRYIDLMGGQKPHLMIATRNNLGAETRVRYASSTRFYLEDKAAGRPWITRLPFPVQVVERVETYDHVGRNRFVSRYAYHHGYFDGVEREFRGFGLVEQFDTEELAALGGNSEVPSAENVDESSHIPPVHTKTWFHTGVYLDRRRISNYFAGLVDETDVGEYYREPGLSDEEAARKLLPDTVLAAGLTVEEERQACRALQGAMLRQEVYGLDGTDREPHPYTVTEQNFTVRTLQPRAGNRHAVFLRHARETIQTQYERNPDDPRVSHALTLDVDDFGNVLRLASVGYGRRQPDPALPVEDQDRQARTLVTCVESAFTNAIDSEDQYRSPLSSEILSYELTGLALAAEQELFGFEEMRQAVASAAVIDYHQIPTAGLQKRILDHSRVLYRRDDLNGALPLGELESLALPFESYELAFTPEHLEGVFGDRVSEAMVSDEGRYVHFGGDGDWWIPSGQAFLSPGDGDDAAQELAFAEQHFFQPLRFRDPFGQTARVEYDAHRLLPVRTVDALGSQVTAHNDYRLLAPDLITDPNGNRSAAAFDVLGMVAGTAVMGKESESAGDSLAGFAPQLTPAQIEAFFSDPRGPTAAQLLAGATSRIVYDEARFHRDGEAAVAATIVRETHASDLGEGQEPEIRIAIVYSDGFGRSVQSKEQAEPGPVEEGGEIVAPRWTTSGWTIFDNKGNPVKQYEPFFSASHGFEFGVAAGVSPTLLYDPLGRMVATLHPNHTWEKVTFDPWRQETWDVNDTVLAADPSTDADVGDYFARLDEADYLPTWHQARAGGGVGDREQDAAQKASAHADTPKVIHFDSLGRPFLEISDNGPAGLVRTRTDLDVEGAPLRVLDNRGNPVVVFETGDPAVPGYDVTGRPLYESNMDAGETHLLPDVGGKPIRGWDSRGHIQRFIYDALQRPTHSFVQRDGEPELLVERTVYGEVHPDAETLNLRGQVYQTYDGAGVRTRHRFDFKGNLLEESRRLAAAYRTAFDWSAIAELTAVGEIEAAAGPLLEVGFFTTRTDYDALNRPMAITTPDDSVTLPIYNEANLLEQVAVRLQGVEEATPFVVDVDYNARGQRRRITYATNDGNNFTTTYDYDPETFRLTGLHTLRLSDDRDLQDLRYFYDPVGNLTTIQDSSQQTVFFANAVVEPDKEYTYDALYRLIRAEGREHAAQNHPQRDAADFESALGIPFPNSPEALQRYAEEYAYDGVGNLLSLRHIGGAVERWTRRYRYADDSNRLLATSLPGDDADEFSAEYSYDAHGNMTSMPHLPFMAWDFDDRLQATARQVVNAGTPETTFFVAGAAGERLRKVTERQAGEGETPTRRSERIYLDGFEVYREYAGDGTTVTLERETLHVSDEQRRIALVDTRTQGDDEAPVQSRRYQLGDHLGSAVLEVDDLAHVISFEDFHPYGSTSHASNDNGVEAKRYRYIGKERDEETALYHCGARYYAPWLGRWTAADPIGLGDGVNQYAYSRCNPIVLVDPGGTESQQPGIVLPQPQPTYQPAPGKNEMEERYKIAVLRLQNATPQGSDALKPHQNPGASTEAERLSAEAERAAVTIQAFQEADQRMYDQELTRAKEALRSTKKELRKVRLERDFSRGDKRKELTDRLRALKSFRKLDKQQLKEKKKESDLRGYSVEWSSELVLLESGATFHLSPTPGSAEKLEVSKGVKNGANTTIYTTRKAGAFTPFGHGIAQHPSIGGTAVPMASNIHSHPVPGLAIGDPNRGNHPSKTDRRGTHLPEGYGQGPAFILGPTGAVTAFQVGGDWQKEIRGGTRKFTRDRGISEALIEAATKTLQGAGRQYLLEEYQRKL